MKAPTKSEHRISQAIHHTRRQDTMVVMHPRTADFLLRSVVLISFGKPVSWLGLYPENARQLARLLEEKATQVEKGVQ